MSNSSTGAEPAQPEQPEPEDPKPAVAPHRPARWPLWLAVYLFCFAGASIGWFATRPLYRSEATVQWSSPPGIFEPRPPVTQMTLDAALAFITTPRIRDAAMMGPDWPATGRGTGPAVARAIDRSLDAGLAPGGMIKIGFYDTDPKVAQAAVRAIATAYYNYTQSRAQADDLKRVRLLEDRRSVLLSQIVRLDQQLLEAANVYGSVELSPIHAFKLQEVMRLEREVQDAMMPPAGSPPIAATRPAPQWLVKRIDEMRQEAGQVTRTQLKIEDLQRQRKEALEQKNAVEERITRLQLEGGMSSGLQIISFGDLPTSPAIDHRPRNAACGALLGLLTFLLGRKALRAWRSRRRVVNARTAFPLVTHYVPPKPVVPIEASPSPSPA